MRVSFGKHGELSLALERLGEALAIAASVVGFVHLGGKFFVVHGDIVARPINRASTIASFFFSFSVVETSRNKASPPFPGNLRLQGFGKPPGVVFFNLSFDFVN